MEDEVFKLFGITDIGLMIAIGIVAWVCKRAAKVPEDLALLIPLVFGGVVGGLQAYESATFGSGILLKGVFMYGAGATVSARLADQILIRIGLIKAVEEPSPKKDDFPKPPIFPDK